MKNRSLFAARTGTIEIHGKIGCERSEPIRQSHNSLASVVAFLSPREDNTE